MHRFSRMHLSPEAALRSLAAIDLEEKSRVAEGVALIAVIDHRRDYLAAGHPSMCDYCVRRLHMSEDKALRRIQVARAALKYPELFECLADGRLSVSSASELAPHLEPATAADLLEASADRRRQEIRRLVSAAARPATAEPALALSADVQDASKSHAPAHVNLHVETSERPATSAAPPSELVASASAERRGRIMTRSDGRYEVRVVLTDAEHEALRRARDLLGHAVPSGDPALVYARAVEHYVAHLQKRRLGGRGGREADAAAGRMPRGRGIPKAIRRAVWERDGGRCTFTSADGHQCTATRRLEFDHIVPVAKGGSSSVENLRVLCRSHNQYEAERAFGRQHVITKRELAQLARARTRSAKHAAMARAETRKAKRETSEAAAAPVRDEAAQALYDDLFGALSGLGFRNDEASWGAALADDMPGASLEACLKAALAALTQQCRVRGERLARCSA